jgi:hypothetical protein
MIVKSVRNMVMSVVETLHILHPGVPWTRSFGASERRLVVPTLYNGACILYTLGVDGLVRKVQYNIIPALGNLGNAYRDVKPLPIFNLLVLGRARRPYPLSLSTLKQRRIIG